MEIITKNAGQTSEFGQKTGSSLRSGSIFALSGDLGSGKTTFVQGLAKGLGISKRITSPTFILMREYDIGSKILDCLYHIDLYRLENNYENELANIGYFEIIKTKRNVVVVEWANKAKEIFTKDTTWFEFQSIDERTRIIHSIT